MLTHYTVQICVGTKEYPVMHLHETFEMCYVLCDGVKLYLSDQVYEAQAGDILIVPPFTFHRIRCDTFFDIPIIWFDEYSMQEKNLSLQPALKYIQEHSAMVAHTPVEDMVEITQLFVDAYKYFLNIDNTMYDFFNTKMLGEILYLFMTAHKQNPALLAETHLSRNILAAKLLSYISKHFDKNISIETITNEFHISKTKLYTIIKNSTGFSYKQLILQMRLTRACDYLGMGMSVTEIANRLGFNSYSHFIKTFKQKTGYSPNKYRNHVKDYAADEYTDGYNFPINRIYSGNNSKSESESE